MRLLYHAFRTVSTYFCSICELFFFTFPHIRDIVILERRK
nr:MAG TPA: Dynactin subunit 1, CAP-Gly domain-containing PROTEIN MICROTUBULE BINDING, DYNACTIN.6A [Caudoviricetes sp.]